VIERLKCHLAVRIGLNRYVSVESSLCNIVNLFTLLGKFHIHKAKFSKAKPCFTFFQMETDIYFESLIRVKNKKAILATELYSKIFK